MLHRVQIAAVLLSIAACRPGEGERCFCQGECRSGLVCAANGAVLRDGECVRDNVEAGACIDGENANADDENLDQPVYLDLGLDRETDPAVTTSPDDDPMTSTGSSTAGSSSSSSSSSDSTGTTAAPTTTGTGSGTETASSGSASTAL